MSIYRINGVPDYDKFVWLTCGNYELRRITRTNQEQLM